MYNKIACSNRLTPELILKLDEDDAHYFLNVEGEKYKYYQAIIDIQDFIKAGNNVTLNVLKFVWYRYKQKLVANTDKLCVNCRKEIKNEQ